MAKRERVEKLPPPETLARLRALDEAQTVEGRIRSTVRGTPAGRSSSRRTTDAAGYRVIKAKYRGTCLACGKSIEPQITVRYWFGHGITCRRCTLT